MSAFTDVDSMHTFMTGFCMGAKAAGHDMTQTQIALEYSRKMHAGQTRKTKEPYLIHPYTMACHALSLGIIDDAIIAAILLHDVVEDCGVSFNDLPVNPETVNIVLHVTFIPDPSRDKEEQKKEHYAKMAQCPKACVVKLIDRDNNVSTMAEPFTKEKILSYSDETYALVMPLYRIVKATLPEYRNVAFNLKYNICAVIDSIKATIFKLEQTQC